MSDPFCIYNILSRSLNVLHACPTASVVIVNGEVANIGTAS